MYEYDIDNGLIQRQYEYSSAVEIVFNVDGVSNRPACVGMNFDEIVVDVKLCSRLPSQPHFDVYYKRGDGDGDGDGGSAIIV